MWKSQVLRFLSPELDISFCSGALHQAWSSLPNYLMHAPSLWTGCILSNIDLVFLDHGVDWCWTGSLFLNWIWIRSSICQLKLDWFPKTWNGTGLVWENLNWNWIGFGQAELELEWLLKTDFFFLFLSSFFLPSSSLFWTFVVFQLTSTRCGSIGVVPPHGHHHLKFDCIYICICRVLAPNSSACAHTVLHRNEFCYKLTSCYHARTPQTLQVNILWNIPSGRNSEIFHD